MKYGTSSALGIFFIQILMFTICCAKLIAQNKITSMPDTITFVNPGLNAKSIDLFPEFSALQISTGIQPHTRASSEPETREAFAQPYSDPFQNSRDKAVLKKTEYKIRWQTALRPKYQPSFVLLAGNRILIEAGVWQLFNDEGMFLKEGEIGTSHLLMAKAHDLFFYINSNGELTGCRFKDGNQICASSILFGDVYVRPFMTIKGQWLIMIENERQLDPHMHYKAGHSIISKYGLEEILSTEETDEIKNVRDAGYLNINSTEVIGASLLERIVFAYPDKLLIIDENLRVIKALSDDFTPLAISTDEIGHIYLLNDNDKGRCLWVITKDGERLYSVSVPNAIVHPPIVGYDHRVFIPCEKNIAVIEADGRQSMTYLTKNKFSGAVITPDDNLLVSDGPQLVTFRANHEAKVIFDFGLDSLCTPAVITPDQRILVASRQRLYCLTAQ